MSKQLHLMIMVSPQAKLRTKTVIVRGRRMTYTPAKSRNAENELVRLLTKHKSTVKQFIVNREVPVYAEVIFYQVRPKHLPKRFIMPTKKPDLDNYEKLALDAIGKILIPSDAQVTTILSKKRFGSPPRIELLLEVDVPCSCGKMPEALL